MHTQPVFIHDPIHYQIVPVIDGDFDRFEMNHDFEMVLREAEPANFYHNALNEEE
jgi:hypothetical protein